MEEEIKDQISETGLKTEIEEAKKDLTLCRKDRKIAVSFFKKAKRIKHKGLNNIAYAGLMISLKEAKTLSSIKTASYLLAIKVLIKESKEGRHTRDQANDQLKNIEKLYENPNKKLIEEIEDIAKKIDKKIDPDYINAFNRLVTVLQKYESQHQG